MRLSWRVPLPGPFSIGGSFGGRRRRRSRGTGSSAGGAMGCFTLIGYVLVAEAWLCWWMLKPLYIGGVLVHRKVTGRNTPIWRSRGGWW